MTWAFAVATLLVAGGAGASWGGGPSGPPGQALDARLGADLGPLQDQNLAHVAGLESLGQIEEPTLRLAAQAELALRHQATGVGVDVAQVPEPVHEDPFEATLSWLTALGVEATDAVVQDLAPLSGFRGDQAGVFAAVMDAHAAVERAVRAGDAGGVVAARIAMVRALADADPAGPVPASGTCKPGSNSYDMPGFLLVDWDGCNTTASVASPPGQSCVEVDYAFIYDVGGSDVYCNNAGGTGHDRSGSSYGSATLINLDGKDRYVGGTYARTHGINGGARDGASGFLFDMAGEDFYKAGRMGGNQFSSVNGGASDPGASGVLIDSAGDDRYEGGWDGSQGGGVDEGRGLLMDGGGSDRFTGIGGGTPFGAVNGGGMRGGQGALYAFGSGDDVFNAGSAAVNGGAWRCGGTGFLYDEGGDDVYKSRYVGVNGGGSGGSGFLYDVAGKDRYTAGGAASNGAGEPNPCPSSGQSTPGNGLLYDAAGCGDEYKDEIAYQATGTDVTVVPKSKAGSPNGGAQIDLQSTGCGTPLACPGGAPHGDIQILEVSSGGVPASPGVSPSTGQSGLVLSAALVQAFGIDVEYEFCFSEGVETSLIREPDPLGGGSGLYHFDVTMHACSDGDHVENVPYDTNLGQKVDAGDYTLELKNWGCGGNTKVVTEYIIVA